MKFFKKVVDKISNAVKNPENLNVLLVYLGTTGDTDHLSKIFEVVILIKINSKKVLNYIQYDILPS